MKSRKGSLNPNWKGGVRPPCSVSGCNGQALAHGLCGGHYQRKKKTGKISPEIPLSKSIGHMADKNGKWKGGISNDRGRVKIYSPDHPFATKQGYVYRYRLVMEKKLGRYLLPSEIVHHGDENKANDKADNLEVTTQSKHIKIHLPKMKGPKWLAAVRAEHQKRKAKAY